VNAPPALATRPPSSLVPTRPADGDRGLTALFDLFDAEQTETGAPSPVRSFRSVIDRLHAWTQESLHRASAWGAGPGGAWRAW
jgi:hypothetical protein